jgi:hypothetical protein
MALTKSGLQWAISPAQHLSLENLALISPVEIVKTVVSEQEHLRISPAIRTMCGIPSSIDDSLPPGVVELRLGGKVLARIESLAVPYGMEREP